MSEDVPPELVKLGMAIKRVRKRRRLSQQDLATASGMRLTTFKEIENATVNRSRRPGTLEGIAAALGTTLEYLNDLANNRVRLEELEDPVVRMLMNMREEFNGKLDSLEKHLGRIDVGQAQQHEDLIRRFDALHRLINSLEVNIDPGEYRHGQDLPEQGPASATEPPWSHGDPPLSPDPGSGMSSRQ